MSSGRDFRIPEGPQPMPAMESEDEESFVVLGQSLMPDVDLSDLSFNNLALEGSKSLDEGKKLMSMALSQLEMSTISKGPELAQMKSSKDVCVSLPSISNSASPADIQEKIEMLIEENVKLRDIILKNNAAMEFQHKKIVDWKEEVHNTHQLHKQKFAEAKNYINRLVDEKTSLACQLEKNKEIRRVQETELFVLKEELKKNSKQFNLQVRDDSPSIGEIEKNSAELDALKKELEETVKQRNEAHELKNEAVAKRNEVEEFLKIVFSQKDALKKEKDEMEQEKNNFISELQQELQKRDGLLDQVKNDRKAQDESASKKISELTAELNGLKSQMANASHVKEDLDNVRKQLMASQENITRLLQTNGVLEAQLTSEQEKVKELKKLESMKDDFFALQQQLEIYKTDFEEERRMKENYKEENKQLSTDFQLIQKRNGELQEELEFLKERGWEYVRHERRTSSTSKASTASSAPPETRFSCPICNFGFLSYQALENHVDRCMNLSATLP